MSSILIVDDSASARMIARRCLSIAGQSGAVFLEAEHGRAALEVLKSNTIDLVVADLNMPIMDGRTLIRFMRSSPRLNEIPVLVVSSLVNEATEAELHAMGATLVLRKPINPAMMAAAISQVNGAQA
jgi:two-component system chemotaxis response regulator CheY